MPEHQKTRLGTEMEVKVQRCVYLMKRTYKSRPLTSPSRQVAKGEGPVTPLVTPTGYGEWADMSRGVRNKLLHITTSQLIEDLCPSR